MLPRRNSDQTVEGIVKAITYSEGPCFPAKALRAWLVVDGHRGGAAVPLGLRKASGRRRYSAGAVNTILEDCATTAQLGYVADLSRHSLPRGMVTGAPAGTDLRDIKKNGG